MTGTQLCSKQSAYIGAQWLEQIAERSLYSIAKCLLNKRVAGLIHYWGIPG
jgi:hypothetical protein